MFNTRSGYQLLRADCQGFVGWCLMNKFEVNARRPHSLQWQQWLHHNDFMPRNQRSFWWKRPRITIFLGYPDFIVIRASRPMKFRHMIPLFPFLYSQSSLLKLCTKATQVGFSVKAHSFQRTCISPSRLCFWLSKAVKDLELTKLRSVEYILPTHLPSHQIEISTTIRSNNRYSKLKLKQINHFPIISTFIQYTILAHKQNVSLPGIHDSGSSLPPSRARWSSVLLALSRKAPRCQPCRHPSSLRHRTLRILLLKGADRLSFITARRADAALLSILPSQPHRRKPELNPSTSQIRDQRLPLSST